MHNIPMESTNVQNIINWQTPQSIHDVQCFMDFVNFFYYKCIRNYSKMFMPSHNLQFSRASSASKSFESLEHTFYTYAPFRTHANRSQPFILEVDASDFAIWCVLFKLELVPQGSYTSNTYSMLPSISLTNGSDASRSRSINNTSNYDNCLVQNSCLINWLLLRIKFNLV